MATNWNPSSPEAIGPEWLPTELGARVINSNAKAAAMQLRSTVAGTIDKAWLYLEPIVRPQNSRWWLEVYEAGTEAPGLVGTQTYLPNAVDTNVGNAWKNQAGTTLATANVAAAIADASGFDASDYAQYTGTYQAAGGLFLEFGSAAWAANRRVVGGRLNIWANRADATGRVQVYYRPPGGGNYALGEITVDSEIRQFSIPIPEANPATGLPWTQSDIALLDSTASIRLKPVGIGKHKPLRVYTVQMELDYVTEERLAVGIGAPVSGTPVTDFVFSNPNSGADNWAKAINKTYTFLLRRLPRWSGVGSSTDLDSAVLNGGSVGWRYLAESTFVTEVREREPGLPDPYMASYQPILNADGTVSTMGDPGVRGYAIYLATTAPAESVDGQPYAKFENLNIYTEGATIVGGGQEFTPPGAATYTELSFILAPMVLTDLNTGAGRGATDDEILAMAPLTVKVKRRSTDAVLATMTLDPEDVLAGTETPALTFDSYASVDRAFLMELDTSIAAPSAQIYFEITSAQPFPLVAGESTWYVVGIEGGAASITPSLSTFGGSTDSAVGTNGTTVSVEHTSVDLLSSIVQQPAAPGDFAATVAQQELITDTQADTPDWLFRTLDYVSCTWDPTSLGADFVAYEVQRFYADRDEWHRLAFITDEDVQEFRDYEGRRNGEATYRVRVHASWHVASEWSAEDSATPTMTECGLLLVANEDPTINQGYVDIGRDRTYNFLSADERQTHILNGRDYHVVTSPLEYRGDKFERTLALWAGSVPVNAGRDLLDRIEAVNSAATSYIAVLDETGRVWYADVIVKSGTKSGKKVHEADIEVIEVTGVPAVIDVSSTP